MAYTQDQYLGFAQQLAPYLSDPTQLMQQAGKLGLGVEDVAKAAQTYNPNITASQIQGYFQPAGISYEAPSTAYQYATGEGGIGLDAMNENIRKFFGGSPTEEAARAAMSEYGVSEADIRRATGKSLAEYYPGALPTSGVTSSAGALSTSDTYTEDRYNPNDPASSRYIADPNAGRYVFDPATGKHTLVTGKLTSPADDLSGETELTTGVKPGVDFRADTTAAENFLMAADPNIQQAFFKPGSSDRYNGTFVETFKVENGKLTPIQANAQDIASGNVLFYVGGAPGGDYAGQNRVAQAYMIKDGKLTPVGEAKSYTVPKETPFFKEFLIEGVLPMLLTAAGGSGFAEALGGTLSGGALTGASAATLGSGALNLGAQLLRGVDPMDAIKTTVLTGGVNAAANSLGALLPAEFAAAGKNILTQLITTGKINPVALATSVGMSAASDVIAAETGLDKATAGRLLNAGYQAAQGNLTGAATSLLQSGALSSLNRSSPSGVSPQDQAAFLEANASPLGLSALSPAGAAGSSNTIVSSVAPAAVISSRDTTYDPDMVDATRGQALATQIANAQEAIRMGAGEAVGTGEIKAGAGEFAGAGASRAVSDEISNAPNFSAAYAAARAAYGPNSTFNYQGKLYSTATFQEDPKLGLVTVAGSGRGEAAGKTAEQEAALENTRQQLAAASAAKPTSLVSSIGNWLSNQMQLSSEAAQNYLKNNPNSPITQSVSTAYDAAGELLSNVAGGTALLLNNKPLADEFIRGGGELQKFGQSIGTGPQDTANFNNTMQLLSAAQGPQEKLAVLAGRILDGTSGLARQTVIELRQELPALFLGGAGARAAMVASGLIDTADTAGNAAIGAYDDAVKSGKTHDQALVDARKAGAAAGATEAAIQLTIGKLGDFAIGKLDNIVGKASGKVLGEGFTEGSQEAGASAAVDLALGNAVDVNKALTQGIVGSAIGKSTALSTTPVDVATSDTASTFNNTLAQTGNITQASTGSVTTAINNGLAPGTAVSTVIDAAAKSGGDMSAVITASIDTGLSTALSSGADTSTAVSTIVAGSVTASLNNGVNASMAVSSTVGSSVKTGIESGADASSVISSSVTAAVSTATQNGANSTAVVAGSTSTAVSTAIASGVDASTAISSAVGSATQAGADASTASASSITAAIAAGTDTNTAIAAVTGANSNITANSTTNNNVTSTTATDATTGVTSQTVVDNSSGASTTTTTNNNVTSQVTTVGSTTTTVTSDTSTGVITQSTVDGTRSTDVTVDPATNVTTQVVTDTTTNTKVTVEWKPDGETRCTFIDPEGQETVFDDIDVGDPPKVDIVAPLEPVKPEVKPETPKETKPKTSQSGSGSAMMMPAMAGAAAAVDWLGPQFLKSKERGVYVDPLAEFQALQQQADQRQILSQIQPELANVLTERGAMPYYAYGQEPSIDEVLGLPDQESSSYNESDYVPVFKSGGKVSPLNIQMMYAKGGHAREDFRDGKHVAGPGDGQSDDIPAWLADGEFVFPADVVSALGNGSTKAGTEKLYEMMHEIRGRARSKHPKDLPPPAHKSPLDYLKKGK